MCDAWQIFGPLILFQLFLVNRDEGSLLSFSHLEVLAPLLVFLVGAADLLSVMSSLSKCGPAFMVRSLSRRALTLLLLRCRYGWLSSHVCSWRAHVRQERGRVDVGCVGSPCLACRATTQPVALTQPSTLWCSWRWFGLASMVVRRSLLEHNTSSNNSVVSLLCSVANPTTTTTN